MKEFLINDRLNSLRRVTNASQSITASLTYKPFGELLSGDPGSQHYLYTGREKDFESVYFYRNRTFNPVHGVFQQSDPIGVTGGLNLYSYVGNNPIRMNDPLGLCEVDAWAELMDALDDLFGEIFGNDLTGAQNILRYVVGGPDPTQMGGGYSSGGGGGSLPGTSGEAVLNRPAVTIGAPTPRALPGQMESNGKGKTIVIGHYPDYLKLAKKIGAKFFNIPKNIWDNMSTGQKWEANKKFLNRGIARGDTFIKASKERSGYSYFKAELSYLKGKGVNVQDNQS